MKVISTEGSQVLSQEDVLASENLLRDEIVVARNSLTTDRLDMSFGEIINMYDRQEIIIRPEFQRLFRWTAEQQTKFIESILLGIPIPPIFVAEDEKGRWELVDGLQRISTIISFFGLLKNDNELELKNNWTLIEGDLVPALDGYNSSNMPSKYLLNIKRATCRVEIIKWDSKWDMRYELFSRLNTGGSALTDQEIRNCIFRSGLTHFYTFINSASKDEKFLNLVALSRKQIEGLYDQELIVRFCSLVNDWENVNSSISIYMTEYMQKMLDREADLPEGIREIFYETLCVLANFNSSIFRYPQSSLFSSTLYDGIMIGVAKNLHKFKDNLELLANKIELLKQDKEFRRNSGSASNSKNRTKQRIKRAIEVFGDAD